MGALRAALAVAALVAAVPADAQALRKAKPLDPAAAMPALPPAVFDSTLEIGGTEIDTKKVRVRMTVGVRINGQGPYRFVVDSGADSSVIGLRAAKALALPAGTPIMLNGITDSSRVERVRVDRLDLGPTTLTDLQLPALQEAFLGGEGMLGIDALVEQRLMMDFEKRVITVDDARQPPPRLDGEIVVTARLRRGQLILTQARAAGRPIEAVIDTGSEISIGNLALRDQLIRGNKDKFVTLPVTGVTGVTVDLQLVRIEDLRLGPIILRDVPIAFADVPPFAVFGLADRPALLVGSDLLETFRKVSLDFRARKVRFQLRRCGSSGIVLTTSYGTGASSLSSEGREACLR